MAEENSARGNPEPAAVVTPAPAPAAPASSLQQQDFSTRIASAKTPAEIRAIKAEATKAMEHTLKTQSRDFNGRPEVTPEATAVAPTPPVEETPVAPAEGEETAEEQTPTPDANEEVADDADDDEGDGPIEPISGKRAHLRLAQDDKVGRLAASLMKRNRDMQMEEAVARAQKRLGLKPETVEVAKETEAPAGNPALPQTVEATQEAIIKLRADRKKAQAELNFELAADLSDQIEDLHSHRFDLQRQGEKREAAAITAYDTQFSASETKATGLYEFAGDPKSVGGKRMVEIDADLELNGDPLFKSPDKPLRIAQMVAAELSIAPRRKGATVTPAKPAAAPGVPAPTQKKQVLPGGSSRTTPPPVNQPNPIDAKIRSAPNTVAGIRSLRKDFGLPN